MVTHEHKALGYVIFFPAFLCCEFPWSPLTSLAPCLPRGLSPGVSQQWAMGVTRASYDSHAMDGTVSYTVQLVPALRLMISLAPEQYSGLPFILFPLQSKPHEGTAKCPPAL